MKFGNLTLYSKIFNYFHYLEGLFHWNLQRFSAIFIFSSFLFFVLLNNLFIFLIIVFFIVFHIFAGIQTLIDDYVHDDVLFLILKVFLKIFCIFFSKVIIVIFLC